MAGNRSEISETAIKEAQDRVRRQGVAEMLFSPDGSKSVIVTSEGPGEIVDIKKSGSNS